jgi:hypothetical protein
MQEMIALYRLDMVWQQKQKEEPKKSPGHTTGRVKQQKHHAETRDPPSQDPRDHMAQADRHNNSPIITSKQTTTTPRRNESGEKKGETDSETRANVRRANVKRTVKQPCGCAQSPLSSAFPIIILLGNFLCSALVVLAGWAQCQKTVDLENYQNEGAVRDILQEHLSRLHHCGLR